MEKLLSKKRCQTYRLPMALAIAAVSVFSADHYSRWEKGLQALQELIPENEKPNMTDHSVSLTADK